jgi:uracil-DNA glycosylase
MLFLPPNWTFILQEEIEKPYFQDLKHFITEEYNHHLCFPPPAQIFAAIDQCPFDSTKVVIIGQDPYHGPGQAHGLSFSVPDTVPFPPSLQNIFKELESDLGIPYPQSGCLQHWADQGVLLLNSILTVRVHQAGSHQQKGWEKFTDAVIQKLANEKHNLVFLLWGSYAQKKGQWIDRSRHLVLESGHPSPLSANRGLWFGNRHFSQTNAFLQKHYNQEIKW